MVSKLGIKGLIPPTERRKKADILSKRKKTKNPNIECLWVTGSVTEIINNEILNEI